MQKIDFMFRFISKSEHNHAFRTHKARGIIEFYDYDGYGWRYKVAKTEYKDFVKWWNNLSTGQYTLVYNSKTNQFYEVITDDLDLVVGDK